MSYRVGPYILYSKNATELAQFLSELLDLDIKPGEPGVVWVTNSLLSFQIIQDSHDDSPLTQTKRRDTVLSFSMDELQYLEDLLYKVKFLNYRQGGHRSNNGEEKAKLHQKGGEYFFFLKDLDGRSWKFFFQS